MAHGSFKGLYTFQEVSEIYGIDNSTLRKQVSNNKLINEVEVKKFGKTWLITEQAMIKHFGENQFNLYKGQITLQQIEAQRRAHIKKKQEKQKQKILNSKMRKGSKYDMGAEVKEDKGSMNNYNDDGKGLPTKMSFKFEGK